MESVAPKIEERRAPALGGGPLSIAAVRKRLATGGKLSGANLEGFPRTEMDFTGADLRGANLAGADLSMTNLENANLEGANLELAMLNGANLAGANFARANLWCASAKGAQHLLRVAALTDANVFGLHGLSPEDEAFIATQPVIRCKDYPGLAAHYRSKGLTWQQMSDLFLWLFTPGYLRLQPEFRDP